MAANFVDALKPDEETSGFRLYTKLSAAYRNAWGERREGTGVPFLRSIYAYSGVFLNTPE